MVNHSLRVLPKARLEWERLAEWSQSSGSVHEEAGTDTTRDPLDKKKNKKQKKKENGFIIRFSKRIWTCFLWIYPLFPAVSTQEQIPQIFASADRALMTAIRTFRSHQLYISPRLSLSLFLSFQSMYYPDPAFDQYTVQQQQQHHHMFHQPHHIMQPHYIQELQLEPLQPIPQPRQVQVSHPYARLFAKKDQVKRRKIWNHALEKSLFNPFEL